MRNKLLTLAGALALLAVLGKFYAVPAIAQAVRAALIENIDEPGRNPFALTSNGTVSDFMFTVPPNKRYVIEQFNATCVVDPTGVLTMVALEVMGPSGTVSALFPGSFLDGSLAFNGAPATEWFGGGTTRLYADQGVQVFAHASSNNLQPGVHVQGCVYSVSGHIINLP